MSESFSGQSTDQIPTQKTGDSRRIDAPGQAKARGQGSRRATEVANSRSEGHGEDSKKHSASRRDRKVPAAFAAFTFGIGIVGGAVVGYAFKEWLDERNSMSAADEFTQNPDALERVMSGDYPVETVGRLVVLQVVSVEDEFGWTDSELAELVATAGNTDELEAVMTVQSSVSQTGDQGYPGWQAGEVGVFPAHAVNPSAVTGDDAVFGVANLSGFYTPEEFLPRSVDTPE